MSKAIERIEAIRDEAHEAATGRIFSEHEIKEGIVRTARLADATAQALREIRAMVIGAKPAKGPKKK